MATARRHRVTFIAEKSVKEPQEITFRTKAGKCVDFVAEKPAKKNVQVSFMARSKGA